MIIRAVTAGILRLIVADLWATLPTAFTITGGEAVPLRFRNTEKMRI